MRTVSMTEAKKALGHLARADQEFKLTSRGHDVAQVRIFATAKFDPEKAAAAAKRMKELGASVKPSRKHGAAATIRKIRDGK